MVFQFVAKLERHTTARAGPVGTAEPDADSSGRNAVELEGRVVRADRELALYREPETGIVDPLGDEVSDRRWLDALGRRGINYLIHASAGGFVGLETVEEEALSRALKHVDHDAPGLRGDGERGRLVGQARDARRDTRHPRDAISCQVQSIDVGDPVGVCHEEQRLAVGTKLRIDVLCPSAEKLQQSTRMIGVRHVHERNLHGPELQQVEVGLRAAVGHEREGVAVGRPRGLQMRVVIVFEARRLSRLQVV